MAPQSNKPWADGPFKLIETPRARRIAANIKKESPACTAATDMTLVHNSMIRILNCIYLQALNIPADNQTDVQDFTTMIYSWSQYLHIHHDNEEEFFFPWIEDDLGVPHGDVLGDNIKQHEGFRKGLAAFDEYVDAVRNKGEQYSGKKLLALLDDFVKGDEGLYIHLNEEIQTLEGLEKYGDKINWVSWNARLKKQAVANGDLEYEIPLAITNADWDFEGDIHKAHWPPFPWIASLFFRFWCVPKHKGAWRFCSCDAKGLPKELPYA